MKRNLFYLLSGATIVLALSMGLGFAQNQVPNLTGKWVGETTVSDMGQTDEVTLILENTEVGYTGTIFDTLGIVPETEIEDVSLEDNTLTFTFTATDGYATFSVSMTLTYEEGNLVGYWVTDDGSSGDIEFHKVE